MKRCPTCNKTFTEEHLVYCVDDGTPLVTDEPLDEATVVRPSADSAKEFSSTGSSQESGSAAYQPPGSYSPPDYMGQEKRRTWPAALGILLVLIVFVGGMAFAAKMLIPRLLRASTNSNTGLSPNSNRGGVPNSNWNSNQNSNSENWNENENANVDVSTPPPTDQNQVLSDLRDLEDEWTVANLNADKKKLNHILADDYVGVTDGETVGKAEYLQKIKRDTATQRWEFQDLKLTLNRDRASLSGNVTFDVNDKNGQLHQFSFRFIDKFVWRDARWQATASELNTVPEKPQTTN